MAAFTTILGMIPLLRDAFFKDMAVTIMAGLAFATVLTLIIVPVLYPSFSASGSRMAAARQPSRADTAAPALRS